MLKVKFTLIFLIVCLLQVSAQQFITPSTSFSKKKTAYVTLKNGNEVKGEVSSFKWKKGMFKGVVIIDETGKKVKLAAKDIDNMYLPPSGLDKYVKATSFLADAQKWNNDKLEQDFLNQGYVYFENVDVKIKKKVHTLLMQVLNPDFSKSVAVYHVPGGKETAKVSIGGLNVAGGNAKSYYVKLDGQKTAFLLTKSGYKKEFKQIWKKCPAVTQKYKDAKWNDLAKHIVEYTEQCGE